MLKKILLATDGSELSKNAVRAAVDFAASYGSTIVGLAVSEIFSSLIMPEMGAGYDLKGIEDEIFEQSKLNADFVAECAKKSGVACEVHTVKGPIHMKKFCDLLLNMGVTPSSWRRMGDEAWTS